MKRKIVLTICILAVLMCIFAISAGATSIPEWTSTDTTYDEQMKETTQFGIVSDTTSRIMFDDGKTYPAWYFIKTEKVNDFLWLGDDTDYNKIGLDFANFKSVSGTSYTKANVVKLEVPVGIQGIGQKALAYGNGLTSLKYVKLPEGLTVIGKYAFKSNSERTGALIQIEMPSTLTTIEDQAFYYCNTLTSVHIPDKVSTISTYAFYRCYALTTITGGSGVTNIKENAFARCPITSVGNMFDNVEEIQTYAFYYIKMESISLPKIKSVGKQVFNEASNLTTLAIGPNAQIGSQAFYNCSKLTTLTVGNGTTFNLDTFNSTRNITTIYYTGSNAEDLSGYNNINTSNVTVNVNHCVAFYAGNHLASDAKELSFSSYTEAFSELSICQRNCGKKSQIAEYPPIIHCVGYSSKGNNTELCIGYTINHSSLSVYKSYNEDKELNIGLLAAAINEGESTSLLSINENGEVVSSKANCVLAPVGTKYAGFDFRLAGFTSNHLNLNILLCAYIYDGQNLQYVTDVCSTEAPSTVTLQAIIDKENT